MIPQPVVQNGVGFGAVKVVKADLYVHQLISSQNQEKPFLHPSESSLAGLDLGAVKK